MKITSFFLLSILISFSSFAQVVEEKTDRAKDRAERKVDNKINEKVDDAVDEVFDSIGSIFKKKKKKKKKMSTEEPSMEEPSIEEPPVEGYSTEEVEEAPGSMADMGMFSGNVNHEDRYRFDLTMRMESTETKRNGKKETSSMDWLVSTSNQFLGMTEFDKKKASLMVFDYENNASIIIDAKKNEAIVTGIPNITVDNSDDYMDDDVKITKTGRTKTIHGYFCEEYTYDSEEFSGSGWVTKEISFFKMNPHGKKRKNNMPDYDGFPMESNTVDKSSGKSFAMKVTQVSKVSKTINMGDYKVMKLGNMFGN